MYRKALQAMVLAGAVMAGFALGHEHTGKARPAARRILYYVDPMHPSYRSNKPGIAPDCGMQLVPVYADEADKAAAQAAAPGSVKIDSVEQQLYGIRLAKVEKTPGERTIRVYGRVAPNDSRIYRLNIGADGYILSTQNDTVGDHVTKGQRLAVLYSPDFLALIGGYLSANEREVQGFNSQIIASQNAAGAQARADRLRNLGMSDQQIAEIRKSRTIPEYVDVVSPTDGFILSRNLSPGERFQAYTTLYTIADLREVWIIADVFGSDARAFRPGAVAKVTLPQTGETISARVSDVVPQVDEQTRALKIRLIAENPHFALQPDMYVNVELPVATPPGITVPEDAVLNSGAASRVFVAGGDGSFAPRLVETGAVYQDRVQILHGLQAGEMVAASGAFLIDSESRLETPDSQMAKAVPESSSDAKHGRD